MWLLLFILASVVASAALPWLERFGFGRLPLDLRLRIGEHELLLPIGSTLVLAVQAAIGAVALRVWPAAAGHR